MIDQAQQAYQQSLQSFIKTHLELIETALHIWNHKLNHVLQVNGSFEQYYSVFMTSMVLKLKVLLKRTLQLYLTDEWLLEMRMSLDHLLHVAQSQWETLGDINNYPLKSIAMEMYTIQHQIKMHQLDLNKLQD